MDFFSFWLLFSWIQITEYDTKSFLIFQRKVFAFLFWRQKACNTGTYKWLLGSIASCIYVEKPRELSLIMLVIIIRWGVFHMSHKCWATINLKYNLAGCHEWQNSKQMHSTTSTVSITSSFYDKEKHCWRSTLIDSTYMHGWKTLPNPDKSRMKEATRTRRTRLAPDQIPAQWSQMKDDKNPDKGSIPHNTLILWHPFDYGGLSSGD